MTVPTFFKKFLDSLSDYQTHQMWEYLDGSDTLELIDILAASHPTVFAPSTPPAPEPPPVDRSAHVLVSGAPVPEDFSHTELKENGQQKDYVVLTADERSKGFVRPYRDAYRHLKCRSITTMSRAIAETYARDPKFYSGTFCTGCHHHFPVGEDGEFVWYEMDGTTGPKVGT